MANVASQAIEARLALENKQTHTGVGAGAGLPVANGGLRSLSRGPHTAPSQEIIALLQHHRQGALLILDLDNFKLINDSHGHLAGDAVLKRFAQCCKSLVRGSDLFVRFGGEEFVALLVGTDKAGAALLAESLRLRIEDLGIRSGTKTIRITSSIGIASVTAKDRSISTVLDRADTALYAAKNAGRNRVSVAA
jgi:diguanylate cyclase (GGDEF)-like protein